MSSTSEGGSHGPRSRPRLFSRRLGTPTRRSAELGLAPSWWGVPSARPGAYVGARVVPHAVCRPLCARVDLAPGRVGSGPIAGTVRRRRGRGRARTSEADRSCRAARRRGEGPSLIGRAPTRTCHGPADIMFLFHLAKRTPEPSIWRFPLQENNFLGQHIRRHYALDRPGQALEPPLVNMPAHRARRAQALSLSCPASRTATTRAPSRAAPEAK